MEAIFMEPENSKINKPCKFLRRLLQRLDLKITNKLLDLLNLSIYYTIAPT